MKGASKTIELLAMLSELPTFDLTSVSVQLEGTFIYFRAFNLNCELFAYNGKSTLWVEHPETLRTISTSYRLTNEQVKADLLAVA